MKRRLFLVIVCAASLTLPILLATSDASADDTTRTQWATEFLSHLGATITPTNTALMLGWQAAENTPERLNNPLATTLRTDDVAATFNRDGVRAYRTRQGGIDASVRTVRAYPTIANALIRSDAEAFFNAPGWHTYCNCNPANYLKNVRATYSAALPNVPQASPTPTAAPSQVAAPSVGHRLGLVHRRLGNPSHAIGLAIISGGLLMLATGRTMRRQYRTAGLALTSSAAIALYSSSTAGLDLAHATARGADALYGWQQEVRGHGTLALLVCAALLLVAGGMERDRVRRGVQTTALWVWRIADETWQRRLYAYPLALWVGVIAAGVRLGQTWTPFLFAGITVTGWFITRKRTVAA